MIHQNHMEERDNEDIIGNYILTVQTIVTIILTMQTVMTVVLTMHVRHLTIIARKRV